MYQLWLNNTESLQKHLIYQIEKYTLKDHSLDIYYNHKGALYAQIGLLNYALSHFNQALKANSTNENAYSNIGRIYFQSGNFSKSLQYFENALKYAPNDDYILFNLALCYAELKNFTKAKQFLEKAIKINPKEKENYENYFKNYYN